MPSCSRPVSLVSAASLTLVTLVTLGACGRKEAPAPTPLPEAVQAPGAPAAPGIASAAAAPSGIAPSAPVAPAPAGEQGLAWTLPSGWTESRPGGMRYASVKPNVPGTIDGSVIALPGPAGGELANVNRWRGQIGLEPLDEAALGAARRPVQSPAGPVAVFDFASADGSKRVIAGILLAGGKSWFVKLTGETSAVAAADPAFQALLASLKL